MGERDNWLHSGGERQLATKWGRETTGYIVGEGDNYTVGGGDN